MSRVNGQIEVERGRLVWELLAHSSLEHACSKCMVDRRKGSQQN